MWRRARALRRAGVMGMNQRNLHFIQAVNPRRLYPRVDDKVLAKSLCAEAGVATPAHLGVIRSHREARGLGDLVADHESFVVKPTRGSQGNGILVIRGREDGAFVRANGRRMPMEDVAFHVAEILSGLYSLAGQTDTAMIEECLTVHPALARVVRGGVPDVRVIVYLGVPVMAMMRLPTTRSDGRANLHQGAVGAGVDLETGRTLHAVMFDEPVERHPDTGEELVGVEVPMFDAGVRTAVRAADQVGLGYVGVDLVVDAVRGPVVLELNARPGLAIQLANRRGLVGRLKEIALRRGYAEDVDERVALGRAIARADGVRP